MLMLQELGKSRFAAFAMLVGIAFWVPISLVAEEVIIEEGSSLGKVACGDYSCSPCFAKLGAASFTMTQGDDAGTIELTAGELWQFFNDQGHDSVNKVSLYLDVDQLGSEENFNLSKLNVQIQNPLGGSFLTNTSLGADGLIVPGYETSATRPEAELSFDLGYDFMELFSSDSKELVRVSVDAPVNSMIPTFHLVADDSVFGQTNLGQLFLFVMFWGAVFLMLLHWMKPVRTAVPARVATSSPAAHRRTA